jgi:hypothetical protein
MNRRSLLLAVLSVLVIVAVAAPAANAANGCKCSISARGDYQILSNEASGAVVRVWVNNPCHKAHQALVTVVAQVKDKGLVQSAYTVYLPCHSSRPLDIAFGEQIEYVSKIIVTKLGR